MNTYAPVHDSTGKLMASVAIVASTQVRSIVVHWTDNDMMLKLAGERGWTPDSPDSLLDLVDESACEKTKTGFTSVTKAKEWARRHKALDLWGQPEIAVYVWPNDRKRSWERETERRLRLIGDGYGWEDVL